MAEHVFTTGHIWPTRDVVAVMAAQNEVADTNAFIIKCARQLYYAKTIERPTTTQVVMCTDARPSRVAQVLTLYGLDRINISYHASRTKEELGRWMSGGYLVRHQILEYAVDDIGERLSYFGCQYNVRDGKKVRDAMDENNWW
ncbi:hypothetical protein K458DRAFT_424668 [Lentithecium fluviatile CBS 122367]|uniref:Uncharacterized protein n=1 Tax=Lentithecium fluviatile CBS 122367 TaxID=1168545 RepID=A0A6G1IE98_9PLEO|nr:hypothetical protein K458DRAFT_424668 [Lentithecium fluviatile CBS 122367]